MKAIIEVEVAAKFYGLVNEDVTKEDVAAGFIVDFNFPKCALGEIDSDSIEVSFGAIDSLIQISPADQDFYGLEGTDGMQAVKFSQPVFFEIEIELEEDSDHKALLNSLDLDWEIYNEEYELESESTSTVNSSIRVL